MIKIDSFMQGLAGFFPTKRFCIAFSGGLDSMVLLHLFRKWREKTLDIELRAIHVHHGLSLHGDSWVEQCKQICNSANVHLDIHNLSLQKKPQISLEEMARTERYRVFQDSLKKEEILVTAHHQDDQAETILLQLFRGAGPKGLAAMPSMIRFGEGLLIRPLLAYDKSALKQYALNNKLSWIEDESNLDTRFDRNFLRHELLPLIENRWPKITKNLARAARHCAIANQYIENDIATIFQAVFNPQNKSLSISLLLAHDIPTQNYIIRYWLEQLGLPLPSTQKLTILHKEVLQSRADATPLVCWRHVEVRRFDNQLFAMRPICGDYSRLVIEWDLKNDLILPGDLGRIKIADINQLGLDTTYLERITIRFRQGGERCCLRNRQHSSSLKKLFQEWRIPPWERNRVPLLYSHEMLRAIIGYAVCA
jgi:tRNA(Ile)-lysidine synthase